MFFGDDGRLAGNVVGQMARDDPGIAVKAAADAGADDEIDRLALVEIGGIERARGRTAEADQYRRQKRA